MINKSLRAVESEDTIQADFESISVGNARDPGLQRKMISHSIGLILAVRLLTDSKDLGAEWEASRRRVAQGFGRIQYRRRTGRGVTASFELSLNVRSRCSR